MEIRTGRFFPPLRGQQDDHRERENGSERIQEIQDAGSATGVLARIRAMLGGAPLETPPAPTPVSTTVASPTGDKPAGEDAAAQNAKLRRLRSENDDLGRQLAESQGAVRVLKEELAGVGVQSKTGPPKPYDSVSGQDHEKIMAFIEKHELDPGKDYDKTLMCLLSKGEIKVRR